MLNLWDSWKKYTEIPTLPAAIKTAGKGKYKNLHILLAKPDYKDFEVI